MVALVVMAAVVVVPGRVVIKVANDGEGKKAGEL